MDPGNNIDGITTMMDFIKEKQLKTIMKSIESKIQS